MRELVVLLFLLLSPAYSIDPPEIEWEVLYGYSFNCVRETSDGNLILTGWRQYNYPRTIFLYSTDGTKIWESSVYPDNAVSRAVVETPDGGFVATGYGVPEAGSTHYSLSLYKVSAEGDAIWSKLYMLPDGVRGYGNNLTLLPDGGMAVCGRKDPPEGMDQAWILRTDSQGDTLWTREWGDIYVDRAADILYHDGGILAFMRGRKPGGNYGVFLVRYSLSGDFEWEASFPEWPGVYPDAQAMCEASDGGLLLMDNYWPEIFHTDYLGNPDWVTWPPGVDQPYGYSLSTTMDGGILYGGEIKGEPDSKSVCGVIARFDSNGNELWSDFIYNSSCDAISSAIQLSQGGYVAAGYAYSSGTGNQGYIVKYAPELGIEGPDPTTSLSLEVSPNPCSSSLSVSFNLPEAGNASIRIFDLSGRLVSTVTDGEFPTGSNTVEWTVPEEIPSGCYFVQYNSDMGLCNESFMLI